MRVSKESASNLSIAPYRMFKGISFSLIRVVYLAVRTSTFSSSNRETKPLFRVATSTLCSIVRICVSIWVTLSLDFSIRLLVKTRPYLKNQVCLNSSFSRYSTSTTLSGSSPIALSARLISSMYLESSIL